MSEMVRVLMNRDGLTRAEAEEQVANVREKMYDLDNICDVEDLLLDELGLEMDYIFDLI